MSDNRGCPPNPSVGHTYTKNGVIYTWNGSAWVMTGLVPHGDHGHGEYVLKAGDTMLGFLTLNANPIDLLHAATKGYVDSVSSSYTLPIATPTILGGVKPDGTTIMVAADGTIASGLVDAGAY